MSRVQSQRQHENLNLPKILVIFERILSGKILEQIGGAFLFISKNYALCWLECQFIVQALPGGLVTYIKLFY